MKEAKKERIALMLHITNISQRTTHLADHSQVHRFTMSFQRRRSKKKRKKEIECGQQTSHDYRRYMLIRKRRFDLNTNGFMPFINNERMGHTKHTHTHRTTENCFMSS